MIERKIIKEIHIRDEWHNTVMLACGYTHHAKGNGWIREINHKERFHVTPGKNKVFLHYDQTINGLHRVARGSEYDGIIKSERKNIHRTWRELDPIWIEKRKIQEEQKTMSKIKKKDRYPVAPNYRDLVRGQELEIISRAPQKKWSLYRSIKNIFAKLKSNI